MYAQAIWFEGPRSAELVAANDLAGTRAHRAGGPRSTRTSSTSSSRRSSCASPTAASSSSRSPRHEDALDRSNDVIMSTELLPGEDPALLPGADRVERYEVVHTMLGKATLR